MAEPPTDDELKALIKPVWLSAKPSREAQAIRAALSCDFDDPRYESWVSDFIPDYVWDLIDIAAERAHQQGYREGRDAAAIVAEAAMSCGCGRDDCYTDLIPESIAEAIRALAPEDETP